MGIDNPGHDKTAFQINNFCPLSDISFGLPISLAYCLYSASLDDQGTGLRIVWIDRINISVEQYQVSGREFFLGTI